VPTDLPHDPGALFDGLTGIACDERRDTLLVVRPVPEEIWEVDKQGRATGRVITLSLPRPPTLDFEPYPKGLAFDPSGTLWLLESIMTAVYEIGLDGAILSEFCHPDDSDGCPGDGNAAFSSDVKPFIDAAGDLFLEITGGETRRDLIRRVETSGELTGLDYGLAEAGGVPSGFLRGTYTDPTSGETLEVFYVLVESSAELHVLAIHEPAILPPFDLECMVRSGARPEVELRWALPERYDAIEVRREGELIATLSGSAAQLTDASPPDGLLRYEVRAVLGGCDARIACTALVGAGALRASLLLEGEFAVDLAEDPDGILWVTFADNRIALFSKELERLTEFPSPFTAKDDLTSGIDFNAASETFFVYNSATHQVAEIDLLGEPIGEPFPSGVLADPAEEEAAVASLLFDPAADGGAGSFWYMELFSSTLEERGRGGALLRSCRHPDVASEVVPDGSPFRAYAWGLSTVPGRGFEVIELAGGAIRDLLATRVLRLDTAECAPTGEEVPLDALAALAAPAAVAVHRTEHAGREAVFVLLSRTSSSFLAELEGSPPAVPHVAELQCAQDDSGAVRIAFIVPGGGADLVEVSRDREVLALVPGDATGYVDAAAADGFRTYRVRARRGEAWSDDRECTVLVGPGSLAARRLAHPASLVQEIDWDAGSRRYLVSTTATATADRLLAYDRDLAYLGEIDSGFSAPRRLAAQAVRRAGGRTEIWCLGWIPGSEPGQVEFPVRVLAPDGRIQRTLGLVIPSPEAVFVTFPSGLAWDEVLDSFWLLERNARVVYNVSPEGQIVSRFEHPAPPHQDGVHNYGLAVDAARGVLYLTSAGRYDHGVTRIVEVTRRGALTGVEVPLDARGYQRLWGFDLSADRRGFLVAGGRPRPWDLIRVRAFDALEPVRGLSCARVEGGRLLSWTNGEVYDALSVFRGVELAASLGGTETSWLDESPPAGGGEPRGGGPGEFYRVVAHRGELSSPGVVCDGEPGGTFTRGDVEPDGALNLTDAVRILSVLFLGAPTFTCADAADVDDDAVVNISDPVRLLNYLFLGGPAPAAPFPEGGRDPSLDSLRCVESE
jgi:hypothetical protein